MYFSDDVVHNVVFQAENEQNKGKIYKTAVLKILSDHKTILVTEKGEEKDDDVGFKLHCFKGRLVVE